MYNSHTYVHSCKAFECNCFLLVGSPKGALSVKNNQITDDYKISSNVLGLGINGKVNLFTNLMDLFIV